MERGSSEHTIASYARDLRRYSAYMATLGVIDPERITTAQVRSFMRELAAPTVPLAGFVAGFDAGGEEQPERAGSPGSTGRSRRIAGADNRLRIGARYRKQASRKRARWKRVCWRRACRAVESWGAGQRNTNR
nr:site-specific integrase [uncultured Rothia sp.]